MYYNLKHCRYIFCTFSTLYGTFCTSVTILSKTTFIDSFVVDNYRKCCNRIIYIEKKYFFSHAKPTNNVES